MKKKKLKTKKTHLRLYFWLGIFLLADISTVSVAATEGTETNQIISPVLDSLRAYVVYRTFSMTKNMI
jgi:hypothetical protein